MFVDDVAVERRAEGRYVGAFGGDLSILGNMQGGVSMAVAIRAMEAELADPSLALRTATAVFAAPVPVGPFEAAVSVLRHGRSLAQCRADLRPDGGEAALAVVAAFGRSRQGRVLCERTPPRVPPPHRCRSLRDVPADVAVDAPPWVAFPFWDHVERRIADGHGWWHRQRPSGRSEGSVWLRLAEPPRLADGSIDPLVHVAMSDMLANAVSEGLGAEDYSFLSLDHTIHLRGSSADEWSLVVHRVEHLADGYASLRGEMWDEHGELLATMTQLALVRDEHARP